MGMFDFGGPESTSDLIEHCYSGTEVPGKNVTKALGLVQYTQKGLAGDMPENSVRIFQSLHKYATELGANAVINVRLTSGSYQKQGSGQYVTYVIAFGDAVILE